MIAMWLPLAILLWVVLGIPAMIAVTIIGGRLLGARRGWTSLAFSGVVGWVLGLVIAGDLTDWEWSTLRMMTLTLVIGSLFTMIIALGLDFFAPQGSLATGDQAGLVTVSNPVKAWKRVQAPTRRYREVLRMAQANGVVGSNLDHRSLPEGVRKTLEDAGGIFVKVGQVASTRGDLLPPAWCDELAKLRSSAEPAPEKAMRPHLEQELGMPVEQAYAEFDWTPIASASVAQVYAATLNDGRKMVVKVQRPGLDELVETDSAAIMSIAGVLERRTPLGMTMKPKDLAEEFLKGVREELDFRVEIANAVDLGRAIESFDGVRVPAIDIPTSSRLVLTEERVMGKSVTDLAWLQECGQQQDQVAARLIDVFLHQMFVSGVFHADPHPGNILMESDGTIVLIDLGAVGHLGPVQRNAVVAMLMATSNGDATALREAMTEVVQVDTRVDLHALDFAIAHFMDQHVGQGDGQGISTAAFAELTSIVGNYGLRLPDWFGTLTRTMITIEGTLKCIDPAFNLVAAGQRFGDQFLHEHTGLASLKDLVSKEAMSQLPRLRRLPGQVGEILEQAATGRLGAKVSFLSDERDQRFLTTLVDRVVFAVLSAAIGVGSVVLLGVDGGPQLTDTVSLNEFLGYTGLVAASVLAMRVIAGIIRDGVV